MDFQSQVESEKFLKLFGSPYKSLGNMMTLKNGVIFIGISDVIIGVFNLIIFIQEIIRFFFWGYVYIYFYLELLSFIVNIVGIFFAFIGIRGITKIKIENIELYYKFKIFGLGIKSFLGLAMIYYDIYEVHDQFSFLYNFLFEFLVIFVSGILTKVVWSALTRLKYNETVLVMHGEAVLIMMQQQAYNIANPNVISPSMPIYFADPSQKT